MNKESKDTQKGRTDMEENKPHVEGFDQFLKRYNEGLAIERAAVEHL